MKRAIVITILAIVCIGCERFYSVQKTELGVKCSSQNFLGGVQNHMFCTMENAKKCLEFCNKKMLEQFD